MSVDKSLRIKAENLQEVCQKNWRVFFSFSAGTKTQNVVEKAKLANKYLIFKSIRTEFKLPGKEDNNGIKFPTPWFFSQKENISSIIILSCIAPQKCIQKSRFSFV